MVAIARIKAALKRWLFVAGFLVCGFVFFVLIRGSYAKLNEVDFSIVWLAGKAILNHQQQLIYPSLASNTFANTLFSDTNFIFLHPPNFAVFATIFALTTLKTSFVVAQIALTISIVLSTWLAAKCSLRPLSNFPGMLLFALTFLPICFSVAIGQFGLMLNLLPLTAGYLALTTKQPLMAGICWACICLKPQPMLAVVAVLVMVMIYYLETSRERLLLISGFLTALAVNLILILIAFGVDGIPLWLHSLKLWVNSYLYGPIPYRETYWLISSLPMAIGYILKITGYLQFGSLIPSALSIIALCVEVFILFKIARSTSLTSSTKLELLLVLLVTGLPIISPYLRVYDLSLYVVAAWFVFYGSLSRLVPTKFLKWAIIFTWIAINVDMLTLSQQMRYLPAWGSVDMLSFPRNASFETALGPAVISLVSLVLWLCSIVIGLQIASQTKEETMPKVQTI